MPLDYIYKKTPEVEKHLHNLDVFKRLIDLLPQLPHLEENLRRKTLLKSSLFSAKIEGNRLNLEDVDFDSNIRSSNIEKLEVYNILHALNEINSREIPQKLDRDFILKLHKIVLKDISADAGHFRIEPGAIFNQAGVAVYITPPPNQIGELIDKFIEQVSSSQEPGPVNSAISHFSFEKIHPFLDGNGRVGRLISVYILRNSGYGFRGIVSFEEYLNDNRQTYYDLLASTKKDVTEFVEFFLEALNNQAEKTVESMKNIEKEKPEDSLLPRRREILEIIKDHGMVTFDFLRRRFYKIPDSTLHYDLKMLQKSGFIRKLGTTRGVCYMIKDKETNGHAS